MKIRSFCLLMSTFLVCTSAFAQAYQCDALKSAPGGEVLNNGNSYSVEYGGRGTPVYLTVSPQVASEDLAPRTLLMNPPSDGSDFWTAEGMLVSIHGLSGSEVLVRIRTTVNGTLFFAVCNKKVQD